MATPLPVAPPRADDPDRDRPPRFHPQRHDAELVRLVGRLSYGANAALLARARTLGYEGFVDWQLDYEAIDDSWLEAKLAELLPTLDGEYVAGSGDDAPQPGRELVIATLARQWASPRQLFERMVEFWNDHFNIYMANKALTYLKPLEDREVMRPHAMGRFPELLLADAKSPAMLLFLDNNSNTKQGPNENYAREVMELHTIGVDGGYDEHDVAEAARCFTGWGIHRPPAVAFQFKPREHDTGAKQVMDLYLPAGGGVEDGEALLAWLAAHPATISRIVNKLCVRFVSDRPPQALVNDIASVFAASGGDIRQTLRALFLHPLVRHAPAEKLERPVNFVARVVRSLQVDGPAIPWRALSGALQSMGQLPFRWPAPNGYPDVRAYWQSSIGFLVRFNLAFGLADALQEQSAVLRQAQALNNQPLELVAWLESALVPAGLDYVSRSRITWYADGLPPASRVAGVAGQLLASPEAQWH